VWAAAYARAWNAGDEGRQRRIGEDYLRYMLEVVDYFESQALAIVGEPIPHVLLIHANALNADWLGGLLDALARRGWEWTALAEAVEHPAYRRSIEGYLGPGGITWLHRWALSAGLDRAVFAGEPEVPAWIEALRQGE
jgi:hypothetical protein